MRVLVVKLSSLGDTLHALPTVAAIHSQTGAEISWAVQPEFSALVACFGCVSRVFKVPRPSNLKGFVAAVREIRSERFDVVVDLQGLLKSAVVARSAHAPLVVGPSFNRECSGLLYSKRPPHVSERSRRHAVEECMDVLPLLGLERPRVPAFPIVTPEIPSSLIPPQLNALSGPMVAVAPFSRWDSKNWPAERFARAIELLYRNSAARVFIIGGKGDFEGSEAIARAAGVPCVNMCGKLTMAESAALIRQCKALLTNDSGPMHIAAALGIRCVAPFGPTIPGRTGPYGAGHVILQSGICTPCRKRFCPRRTKECMFSISAEQAVNAILQ